MSRNLRNAAFAFTQRVLGAVTGAVGMFFIARQMPDADLHLGIVGFALSFVGMFLAIQRAFDDAHVKRISEGRDLATCNATYLVLNLVSTGAMILLVLGSVFVWTDILGRGFQSSLQIRAIELILVYQVLNSAGEFVRRTFEGQQNIILGQIILSAEHVLKGAATVYVAFFGLAPLFPGTRDAIGLAGAYVAGGAALALVALILLIGQPFGRPSWDLAKSYARYGLQTTLTATVTMVGTNAGAVLLQLFWSSRDVSYFFAPNRYIQFLPAVAGALSTSLFPVFSRLHASGRTAPDVVLRMIRATSLLLLPIVAVTVVLPDAIVHVLLSDRFLQAAPVMAIMAAGFYIKAFRQLVSSKLGGVDRPGEVTKAATYSMLATVGLGIIFVAPSLFGVPLLGRKAPGMALALTIGQFIGFGTVLKAAKTHAGVELAPLYPNMARQAIMFLGTCGVLYGISLVIDPLAFRFFHLILVGLLSPAVFLGLGLVVGEIHLEDLRRLWRMMRPGEWLSFLQEETRRPRREDDEEE